MNFIYLSKNFNRCGYYILEHLINVGLIPKAVILPSTSIYQPLDDPSYAPIELKRYLSEVKQLNGRPLRFVNSIKLLAESNNIPVLGLASIKTEDTKTCLSELAPDVIVLGGGWPELIPAEVISLPKHGILNTHPSLLPDFRGRDVHRWQIAAGIAKSGVTIHYVNDHFDTGDILAQAVIDVAPNENPQGLIQKIAYISGPLMESVINKICTQLPEKIKGEVQPDQDDRSRYFGRWKWDDPSFLRLDWSWNASELVNFIRACSQESFLYNGPYTGCHGFRFIVRDAEITTVQSPHSVASGQIIKTSDGCLLVSAGIGSPLVALKLVQKMTQKGWPLEPNIEPAFNASELIDTFKLNIGDILN